MSDNKLPNALFGQRTLAAIVFTDVVNFSGLVQQNEEHALRLVQRDLDGIRAIAARQEGQVLKSTGDGLLIFFNSAVQAVSCSLEIQRWLAAEATRLAPGDALQHRIGIHLGDVFVSETDVMGDGVNIAARLQTEAEPGGICISQTVYDVVKNQLGIKTTYLGPRDLKNIRQAVPVYRILIDAHAAQTPSGNTRTRSIVVAALIGVFAAAAVLFLIAQVKKGRNRNQQPVLAGQPQPASPQAQLTNISGAAQSPAHETERAELLGRYDFARLAQRARETATGGKMPLGSNPPQHYEELADLWNWTAKALSARTESKPLVVSVAPLGGEPFEVWPATGNAERKLSIRRNGQVSQTTLAEMKPVAAGLIVLNLIEQSEEPPARKQQLLGAFLKFAREYRLDPNLIETRVAPKLEKRFQRPFRGSGGRTPTVGAGARRQPDGVPPQTP
jgi:class 3 adenylate cyclase